MEALATRATTNPLKNKNSSFFKGNSAGDNFFQPKLSVGPVDDVYEREADAVADRVMSGQKSERHHAAISSVSVQRKCAKCEEEERLQRKAGDHSETGVVPPEVNSVLNAPGKSLDEGTKSFMENRFGYDFSQVKIHTGNQAAQSADSINALAYTSGNNIVFNSEQFKPDTDNGKRLLAHELTHVVQQNAGGVQAKKIQRQCVTTAPGSDEHAFTFRRHGRSVTAEFADAAGAEAFIQARSGQNLTCHRIRRGRRTIFKVFQRTTSSSGSQSQPQPQPHSSQQGSAATVQDEIFTSEEVSRMRSFFIHNASGGDAAACINTVRTGVSSLVFDDSDLTDGTCPSQVTMTQNNTMEETMTQLHGQHMASAATVIHFNDSTGHEISAGTGNEPMTLATSVWSTLTTAVGSATGFSVFGISLCDGFHSVTLTVDHTNPQSIAVFWSDQTHHHPVQASDRIRGVSGDQYGWERMVENGSSQPGSSARGLDAYITYAVRRFWGLDETEAQATTPLTTAQRSGHTPLGTCAPIIRVWRISRP